MSDNYSYNYGPVNSNDSVGNYTTNNVATTVINVLNYIDLTIRCLTTLVYLLYFAHVAWFKEQRKVGLFYVHHANFVNFIYVLIYLSFFNSTAPSLGSKYLNDIFCRMVEILFGLLKFLRSYSVLLVALYRLSAVYAIKLHRRLNETYKSIFGPVLLVWAFSWILTLATKFGFNTTYGSSLCTDGYSTLLTIIINYWIVTAILSIVLPFSLTMTFYYLIKFKLDKSRRKSLGMSTRAAKEHKTNKRFSQQLRAMGICYWVSFMIAFVQSFRYIIPGFNTDFYYLRQGLRILNLISIAFFPLISVYFSPAAKILNKSSSSTRSSQKTANFTSHFFSIFKEN